MLALLLVIMVTRYKGALIIIIAITIVRVLVDAEVGRYTRKVLIIIPIKVIIMKPIKVIIVTTPKNAK